MKRVTHVCVMCVYEFLSFFLSSKLIRGDCKKEGESHKTAHSVCVRCILKIFDQAAFL